MRIDKINDNQIRCFLSKEDMESRQLHLKELAYGTEKARALFHELLREARARFGFEVENMPVMVEAVPLQDDSLVLIVSQPAARSDPQGDRRGRRKHSRNRAGPRSREKTCRVSRRQEKFLRGY